MTNHKSKRLEDRLTYEDMENMRVELDLNHNDIFCGYLRQPITAKGMVPHQYIIKGRCVLDDSYCHRAVGPNCFHDLNNCPIYKKYVYNGKKQP